MVAPPLRLYGLPGQDVPPRFAVQSQDVPQVILEHYRPSPGSGGSINPRCSAYVCARVCCRPSHEPPWYSLRQSDLIPSCFARTVPGVPERTRYWVSAHAPLAGSRRGVVMSSAPSEARLLTLRSPDHQHSSKVPTQCDLRDTRVRLCARFSQGGATAPES